MMPRRELLLDRAQPFSGPLFDSLTAQLGEPEGALEPGTRVGPYRILSLIGQGGMARVYLADRADGEFEQQVALKIAPGSGADAARRVVLRRERQILARLQHPRIARLLDGGTTSDGLIWFAMEPVDGEHIDRYCARRKLHLPARIRLLLDVCDAVHFAHSQLLVHRDIKPSNVLVTGSGEVKLLDFGIADMLDGDDAHGQAPHALSPKHASPEQLAGDRIGTASDLWQLGRLLARLLDPEAGDSTAPCRVPQDLAAILSRATTAAPSARYGSVAEFAADLDRFLRNHPVHAHQGGATYVLRLFLRRHRRGLAVAVLTLLAFVLFAVHSAWQLALQREIALRNAERATATTSFLLSLFAGAQPNAQGGDALSANQILAIGERRLATDLQDQPSLRASLLSTIAQVHLSLGQFPQAERLLHEAVRLGRGRSDVDGMELALRLRELARAQWRQDRFEAALASARDGESLLDDRDEHASTRVLLLNTQGAIAVRLGRYEQARDIQLRAVALGERHLPETRKALAYAWNNLGAARRGALEHAAALAAFERALALIREQVGPEHTDSHAIASELAIQRAWTGDVEVAMEEAQSALAGLRRLLSEDSVLLDAAYRSFAVAALRSGRADLALPASERAWRGTVARRGEQSLAAADVATTYGESLLATGSAEAAAKQFAHALRIRSRVLPEEHPEIALDRQLLARASCSIDSRATRIADPPAQHAAAGGALASPGGTSCPEAPRPSR